ncbi:MAG: GntR family transcriptional regulator, partial [Candidatus Promineifilaceae bacterium]|nr:GntR family transcriptional regulator [Candidatus Promineifilaceae bacterium]
MDPETAAIYGEVRERIGLLHYQPGELLSENALAAEFEISRTRMRRIMWQLESDGLIVISKGTGAVVTAVDIKSLREVYVVRLKLLELLGELKPARLPAAMLENLEAILEQSQQLRDTYDPDALARLYYAFHGEMLNIIRNKVLRKITDQLYHQTSRAWVQLLT